MSYTRQPNVVIAGQALIQNPPPSITQPAGILPVTLDCEIATTSSLGVVKVGSGLAITPAGVLSAICGSGSIVSTVKLTSVNYTALPTDYYIGATANTITITLPLGVLGQTYAIQNQVNGSITVTGTSGQTINTAANKLLGAQESIIVIFDGTRWNII